MTPLFPLNAAPPLALPQEHTPTMLATPTQAFSVFFPFMLISLFYFLYRATYFTVDFHCLSHYFNNTVNIFFPDIFFPFENITLKMKKKGLFKKKAEKTSSLIGVEARNGLDQIGFDMNCYCKEKTKSAMKQSPHHCRLRKDPFLLMLVHTHCLTSSLTHSLSLSFFLSCALSHSFSFPSVHLVTDDFLRIN